MPFDRILFHELAARLTAPRRFLQVVLGPRQTGKTTGVLATVRALGLPTHIASVDEAIAPPPQEWIRTEWGKARVLASSGPAVLVLDEIQKVEQWSAVVKGLWDQDSREERALHVVLLGSSTLLIHEGLSESLAGRFEVLRAMHWSFSEMREAFGFDVDQFVYFGGYPGSAALVPDVDRWRKYIRDGIIETTVSRDILMMTRVDKPALLRALFQLACTHAGQVLSYTKMLGLLQDRGNTATLSHYLELLSRAGLVTGITKFTGNAVRQRGSSPKLLPMNTALVSASGVQMSSDREEDPSWWGRIVETCVGAHLYNTSLGTTMELFWWREGNHEIDFVLRRGDAVTAIEVKTGAKSVRWSAFQAFERTFGPSRLLVVGTGGIELGEFLSQPADSWLAR